VNRDVLFDDFDAELLAFVLVPRQRTSSELLHLAMGESLSAWTSVYGRPSADVADELIEDGGCASW
jgi:hypothetical protein